MSETITQESRLNNFSGDELEEKKPPPLMNNTIHFPEIEALTASIERMRSLDPGRLTSIAQLIRQGDLTFGDAVRVLADHLARIAEESESKELHHEHFEEYIQEITG